MELPNSVTFILLDIPILVPFCALLHHLQQQYCNIRIPTNCNILSIFSKQKFINSNCFLISGLSLGHNASTPQIDHRRDAVHLFYFWNLRMTD